MKHIAPPAQPSVTPQERDLVFDVTLGVQDAIMYIYQFRTVWVKSKGDFPYMDFLRYLKKHRIVGNVFVDMINEKFNRGVVEAAAYFRKKINKEFKTRKVIAKN